MSKKSLFLRKRRFNIAREFFKNNEQGLWLDPSQMSTLYQDSNGVTPCTAAGDPVGLILDQSRGGLSQIGADLVTNGGFDSDTAWSKDSGWQISGGVLRKPVADGTTSATSQPVSITGGKWYRVIFTATISAGEIRINLGSTTTKFSTTSSGTHTVFVFADSTTSLFYFRGGTTFAGSVDNVSVREVPGNHAYQSTSGARPTFGRVPFGGRRNLLTRTEEFDNAAWTKIASSITANADTAPDGTTTADLLTEDSTSNVHHTNQSFTTTVQTYTFSVYLKNPTSNGRRYALLYHNESVKGWTFDLLNGVVGAGGTSGVTAPAAYGITAVGNGWYRCYITVTGTAASNNFRVYLVNNDGSGNATYLGDGTSRLLIWGAQLETGSTATNYQRVGSTHDVTQAGQPDCWYLDTSGSKWMQTNAIDFSTWTQETRRNLLVDTESLGTSNWSLNGATFTANTVTGPSPISSAGTFTCDGTQTGPYTRQSVTFAAAGTYVVSVVAKKNNHDFLTILCNNYTGASNGSAYFDLNSGTTPTAGATITSLGDGWYRCSVPLTVVGGDLTGTIQFHIAPSTATVIWGVAADNNTKSIYLTGAQVEASVLTTYQRVGTDEMTVIAGVRKLSDAATGCLMETSVSPSTNNGAFNVLAPRTNGTDTYGISVSQSALLNVRAYAGFTAPISNVLSANLKTNAANSAAASSARFNGVAASGTVAIDAITSGNFGNHILYIGCRGAGASLFFNGHIFHLIIRGKTTEGSKLTGAERITARNTGITI